LNKEYFIITLILSAAVMFFTAYQLLKQKHLLGKITYTHIFLNLFWIPTSLFLFVSQKTILPKYDLNNVLVFLIYINIFIVLWFGIKLYKENKSILATPIFEWVRGYKDDH